MSDGPTEDPIEAESQVPAPDDAGIPDRPVIEQLPALAEDGDSKPRKNGVLGVPIEVLVSVGKARPMISELVGLRRDSVLTLDSKIEDPVEIFIGDRLIARGELQEMDGEEGRLGVRLTEVEDLSNGV